MQSGANIEIAGERAASRKASAPSWAASPVFFAICLSVLTIVGAWLRIKGLDKGMWLDEIHFLLSCVRKPLPEIITIFPGDYQHPLYAVLARLSVVAFGEHPWSLRLPAMLFGTATIPALYLLGTTVATRMEALAAALFLTVSYHHVWFSQNARGYSALAFWTVLATFLLMRGIQTERRGFYLAYGAAIALALYTHLTIIFLVATHVLILGALAFSDWRKGHSLEKWKYPLYGLLLAVLFTLLLYAPILFQVEYFFSHHQSHLRGLSTPGWALRQALRVLSLGLGTWVAVAGAALLAICGAVSYYTENKLALALFVLPAVLTAIGAVALRGTIYPRFFFFLIGFAVLILVRGLFVVPRIIAPRRAGAITTILLALLVAGSSFSLARNYRYGNQDFGGAVQFVNAHRQAEDAVVAVGATIEPIQMYYREPWQIATSVAQLRQICEQGRPVWVIYTFPRYLEAQSPGMPLMIRKQFTVERVFPATLEDGDIFVAKYR